MQIQTLWQANLGYRPGNNFLGPSPEQWTFGGMHKICQRYHQTCFDNNSDVNCSLLQIKFMPIGTGLPRPAILLFNRLKRALLSQINSKSINYNADDENYEAFILQQGKYLKNSDTHRDSISLPIGSMVVVKERMMGA